MKKQHNYFKGEILSIDAWRDQDGWSWNNSFTLESDVVFREDQITPRIVLRKLREWNYLSKASIGTVRVEDVWPIIEIQAKGTYEPILAIIFSDESYTEKGIEMKLTKKDWQDAMDVQSACNLSGVVKSFAKVMEKIFDEGWEGKKGTDWINTHPIARMYAEQILYLSGGKGGWSTDGETYANAYDAVLKAINEMEG